VESRFQRRRREDARTLIPMRSENFLHGSQDLRLIERTVEARALCWLFDHLGMDRLLRELDAQEDVRRPRDV
jgi:hypothetical protein